VEPVHIGRYEIQRRLGRGGMGSLYLARDPGLDRLVAIKLLKDDYQDDPDFRERFAREARALARLRHPHIIVVYDFGEHDGRLFMAMEYIDGETLDQRLRRQPPLPLPHALELVEDLCAGLGSAHDAGIVHRDIKPENIMLDSRGVLKLLDFGIARQSHNEAATYQMTQPGMVVGSFNYMAPEQHLGENVDQRSDIFAVGAVLYQVIALKQAFPGREGVVYHTIFTTGPVPLEQHVPDVDPELAQIARRALDREPDRRYQSAAEMGKDLARVRRRIMNRDSDFGGRPEIGRQGSATPISRSRDSEARRGLISEQLRLSQEAFARGDHETALQYAERAAFVDPNEATALDLIAKARLAIETQSILRRLKDANELLLEGRLTEALAMVDQASAAVPDGPGAMGLREEVRHAGERVRAAIDRQERIDRLLQATRSSIERGGFETALRSVHEVLALAPDMGEAQELERHARTQLEAQRQHERAMRHAYTRLNEARALAREGRLDEADATLGNVMPITDTVRRAAAEVAATIERLRREAAVNAVVADAGAALVDGQPDQAISILASIAEEEYTAEAHDVRARAQAAIAQERESALARQRLEEAISSVRLLMDKGALVEARARLLEIDHSGLPDERIGALQTQLEEMAAAEARRLEEERNLDASKTVVAARRLFATGDASGAVDLLEHKHEHPLVDDALRELRTELARIDERNRQEREQQEIDARQRARAEAESETEKTLIRSPERTIVRPAVTVGHRAKADDARRPENHHHARDAARVRAEQERPVTQKELTALAEHASRGDIAGQTPAAVRPASTRAGIVLLVLALAAGIGLGGYRFFSDGSSASPPVVSEPGSATGAQEAERVAPPDELEKPADVPANPPAQLESSVQSRGTVVLDALPWAEVVRITDERGNRLEIPPNSFTPLTLMLPAGDYEVALRNGSTRTAKIRVTNDGVSRMDPIDFGRVDPADYFQRQGWR